MACRPALWLRPDGHTVTKMSSSSKRTGTNPDLLLASCMSRWCVRDMSVVSPCLYACRPFKLSVWIYEGVCVGSYKYPQTVDLIEIRCGMKRNSLPTQQLPDRPFDKSCTAQLKRLYHAWEICLLLRFFLLWRSENVFNVSLTTRISIQHLTVQCQILAESSRWCYHLTWMQPDTLHHPWEAPVLQ